MKIIGSDKGIHSPEFHKKKTRQRRIRQVLIFIVVVLIIALPIALARSHKFLITNIEVSGNDVTKSEDIERIVARNLAGDYAWIFPHSNTAIYPKKKIVSDLLREEPRLSSVVIARQGLRGMKVTVTERAPVAEYCKDVSVPSSPRECYFIDDTGYIFAQSPAFSGNVYLTYTTSTIFDEPIGKVVLTPQEFAETRRFVTGLADVGIFPRVFVVKSDEYHLLLSNGTEILWDRSTDLTAIHTSLASFLEDRSIQSVPNFLSKVAYIDLRFGNKIFYKYRGE